MAILKKPWKVINSSLGRNCKVTVINELVYEGKDFTEKQDIAEQMNHHFCSLGSKLASGIPDTAFQPEDFSNRADSNFYFRHVSEGYIYSLITKLKPSVSCGLDNISRRLLKLCSPYISNSICDITETVKCWRLEYFSCYCVNGNALQLLKSYLIDRTQRSLVT